MKTLSRIVAWVIALALIIWVVSAAQDMLSNWQEDRELEKDIIPERVIKGDLK